MDLYGRLEELQGMTRLLIDDVGRLQGELGAGEPDPSTVMSARRSRTWLLCGRGGTLAGSIREVRQH